VKVMADNVGHQRRPNYRGRAAPRRPRGHADRGWRGGRGHPRGQGQHQRGERAHQGQIEDNGAEDNVVEPPEPVAPPRELPRRRFRIGAAALDRMLQLPPEELILQITNRVSVGV